MMRDLHILCVKSKRLISEKKEAIQKKIQKQILTTIVTIPTNTDVRRYLPASSDCSQCGRRRQQRLRLGFDEETKQQRSKGNKQK